MNTKKIIGFASVALLCLTFVGADTDGCGNDIKTGQSTKTEMEQTETNQQRLATAQPPPQFNVSLERKNLIERLKRLNTENRIGYVYLLSKGGAVMAFYTISGKVSSLNSLLTTPEQIVVDCSGPQGCGRYNLPSPDLDGSYGKNPEGIFFFTTAGALVEWSGDYMYSDQPLHMTTQPILIEQLPNDKK
jgi:hypothetical protein